MDSKVSLNPASEETHYTYVIVVHFNTYIVTVPTPKSTVHSAVSSSVHNWISKFGPLQYLITDGITQCLNTEIANCCFRVHNKFISKNIVSSMNNWTC